MITRINLELKKYPEALKSLDEAKAAKADQSDIHVYQGAYYLETNEPQKAIKELEEAIKMNPENAYAYYYAGYAYVRLGHPADGEKALKRFLELAPYAPEAEKAKILVDVLC
jgi:predicted Zn-dependent protease